MRLKQILTLAAFSGVLWSAHEVGAATNVFLPFSGYAFRPASFADNAGLFYSTGRIMSAGDHAFTVEAPLGHAAGGGGGNGFTVYGRLGTNGESVVCSILVTRQSDGVKFGPYTGTSVGPQSAERRYTLFVRATPPQGAYFYTMRCSLPNLSDIGGVLPDA